MGNSNPAGRKGGESKLRRCQSCGTSIPALHGLPIDSPLGPWIGEGESDRSDRRSWQSLARIVPGNEADV